MFFLFFFISYFIDFFKEFIFLYAANNFVETFLFFQNMGIIFIWRKSMFGGIHIYCYYITGTGDF